MSFVLETRSLVKDYGGKIALSGIDLALPEGKIIGLLGSNGSGKTTLLKLAAGLLQPTSGEIRVCEREVGVETKSLVSFLPERTYLNDWMRVIDIIEYFDDFYEDFDRSAALHMLENLGVKEAARLKTLSKGTKEKVQLILVMSRAAKLYILDEPLSGIDPAARDSILDIILKNYTEDSTVLLSTHLIYDVERIFDDVVMMDYGRLIAADSADALREKAGKSLDAYFREVFKC